MILSLSGINILRIICIFVSVQKYNVTIEINSENCYIDLFLYYYDSKTFIFILRPFKQSLYIFMLLDHTKHSGNLYMSVGWYGMKSAKIGEK